MVTKTVHFRPIFKKFPTEKEATAWLQGAIPRGLQVDPRLPDSLRWDGVAINDTNSSQPASNDARFIKDHLLKLERARAQGFMTTEDGALVVYTDGSAKDNGKKGARAGSGVWWGKRGSAKSWQVHFATIVNLHLRLTVCPLCTIRYSRLSERVPGPLQTNNRGEMIVSRSPRRAERLPEC